jgi:hypothetical protein
MLYPILREDYHIIGQKGSKGETAALLLVLQVLKVVAAAVEGALAGQKKQDKLKGRINHEFNKVSRKVISAELLLLRC